MAGFETCVSGKWILAGEHSVLRGSPALVFPLSSRQLRLSWKDGSESLQLQLSGEYGEELQLLFWGVLEKGFELTQKTRRDLGGIVQIQSEIPIGAGLGASAALCVAVGRWFESLGWLKTAEVYEFARTLENLFHGESSGLDIAVALGGEPLKFLRNGPRSAFSPKWKPMWFVSYSGKRGVTSECVARVKEFIIAQPNHGKLIDEKMKSVVDQCEAALVLDEEHGFAPLASAINQGRECFEAWGLSPQGHVEELQKAGALAVKPTGSGGGGYVLSLWKTAPPKELLSRLIPC